MKLTLILRFSVLATLPFQLTSADNILFLTMPFFGHLNPMFHVAGEMTNLGHTSYITIPERFLEKLTPKTGVNYVIVEEYEEFKRFYNLLEKVLSFSGTSWSETLRALQDTCDRYLFDEDLFVRFQSINASMIVVDENFVSNCLAIIAYKLFTPFVLLGLHNQYYIHRTPWLIPFYNHIHHVELATFSQRLANTLSVLKEYSQTFIGSPGRSVKEYVPKRPGIAFERLLRKTEMFILDCDPFLDPALPALPNVKYVGGMGTRPANPLQGALLKFVEASKNGVVVVSPGSFVNWGKEIHVRKLEEAFSKIKYDVVWKHSNASYSRQNVFLTKWLPQNDLLGHRKTKLFITHCGNSGQYESLYHAIPMIGFPVLADQPLNGRRMQVKGFGISMNMYTYTVDELVKNIVEVIENPKYKRNIAKTSKMFRSQKERPAEKAARLIDEMIQYGGEHLRSEYQDLPLYQFLMLDMWTLFFSVMFLSLGLTVLILRKCFTLIFSRKVQKNIKRE